MPRLTSESAAKIAKAAGLGMPDAAALLQLADTDEEAENLAAQFSRNESPEQLAKAVEQRLGRR